MKRKIIGVLLIMTIAMTCIVGLSACGKDKTGSVNELTIWAGGQWTGTDLANLKNFIKSYNETNTKGLTIKVVAKSDMETALATAVHTGKTPDILIWDRFNTPTYAKTDALMDVTTYIERDGIDTTVFNDDAMNELRYGGKCYGLPLDLDVWGLYVNMDMVTAHNAAHPDNAITLSDNWTWNDLYTISQKLATYEGSTMKVAGYSGHVMHQHYFKYFCSTSQDFLNAAGEPNFDTAQSRKILEFFREIGKPNNGIWESGLCEKSNFTNNTLAIIDQSLYFTDYIDRYNPTMNYRFMPQPRYEAAATEPAGVNGGMLGGFGLAFPKPDAEYLTDDYYARFESAWSFAQDWLLSEEFQSSWSNATGTLPALKSLYTGELVTDNETLRRAASFVDAYNTRPQIPGYLHVQTQVIDTAIKAYTQGTASIDDTINTLITGYEGYAMTD